MKTTVIHHSADYDGIFCREIARKFLPEAELIGWDFPDKPLTIPPEGTIYILDLPVDRVFGLPSVHIDHGSFTNRVIWIDHHKSSIESHPPLIAGYRIDGVAACRLAWQWFKMHEHWDMREIHPPYDLPGKEQYIARQVLEPLAVRLAGEYDIWDHRDNDADIAFQFGLDSYSNLRWDWLLSVRPNDPDPDGYAARIVEAGRVTMQCYAKRDADILRTRSFLADFEGLKFLVLNTARANSNTFAARDVPETGHDALLAYYWDGQKYNVSLYHAAHRKDLDLSQIARRHGGGGHKGACGFRIREFNPLSAELRP